MKKTIFILIMLSVILSGCVKKEEENPLKANWTLEETLKPAMAFERSKTNDSYGIFYIDNQIKYEDFIKYVKSLEESKFSIDWRYSDTSSIKEMDKQYSNLETKDNVFSDGYVNVRMCREKSENQEAICFFMQWVNKEIYNKLNPDKPNTYSFKLEPEKIENQG